MTKLISLKDTGGKLPDHILKRAKGRTEDLTAGATGGFKVLSIKGKTFSIVSGEDREVIPNPKDPDSPATYLDVVLVRANRNVSKIYYEKDYEEGDSSSPDCFSLDGVRPDPSAPNPQHEDCATCPHNQWGSRVTDSGKKAKRCQDHRRVAVASPADLDDVMLLRVPPKSLKALAEYARKLSSRGVEYNYVVTRISFVQEASSPQLAFKALAFLPPELCDKVDELYDNELVRTVIGLEGAPVELQQAKPTPPAAAEEEEAEDDNLAVSDLFADDEEEEEKPAPKKAKKTKAKKAKAAPPPEEDEDEEPEEPEEKKSSEDTTFNLDDSSFDALRNLLEDD